MKFMHRWTMWGAAMLVAGAVVAADPPNTLQMTTKVTTLVGKEPVVQNGSVWLKGGKMRMEQGDTVVIIDGKEQIVYSEKDGQKIYRSTPLHASEKAGSVEQRLEKIFAPPYMKSRKKIGGATILGHPTAVYEAPAPSGQGKMKLWIATDLGAPIPLKVEMRMANMLVTREVTALKVNPVIADKLFAPPAGYKKAPAAVAPSPGRLVPGR